MEGPSPSWHAYFEKKIKVPKYNQLKNLKTQLGELRIKLFDYEPTLETTKISHKITYLLEKKFLG